MSRTHFYLACIQTNPDDTGDYIAEAKQLGIEILPPDINYSETDICVKDNQIYFGFSNIKHVGRAASNFLIKLREKQGLFSNRMQLDNLLEDLMIFWEYRDGKRGKSPKQKLDAGAIDALENAGAFDRYTPCPDLTARALLQQDLLGIVFVDVYTPLTERNADVIKGSKPIVEASGPADDCYGILSGLELRKTRATANPKFANQEYAVLSLDWRQQTVKVTCFSQQWKAYREDLVPGSFWRMYLQINDKGISLKSAQRIE